MWFFLTCFWVIFEDRFHLKDCPFPLRKHQNHRHRYQNLPHLHLPHCLLPNNHHHSLDHASVELNLHQHHHFHHYHPLCHKYLHHYRNFCHKYLHHCRRLCHKHDLVCYHCCRHLPDVHVLTFFCCLYLLDHYLMVRLWNEFDNKMIGNNYQKYFGKFVCLIILVNSIKYAD